MINNKQFQKEVDTLLKEIAPNLELKSFHNQFTILCYQGFIKIDFAFDKIEWEINVKKTIRKHLIKIRLLDALRDAKELIEEQMEKINEQ